MLGWPSFHLTLLIYLLVIFNSHHPEWDSCCPVADTSGIVLHEWLLAHQYDIANSGVSTRRGTRLLNQHDTAIDITAYTSGALVTGWTSNPFPLSDHCCIQYTVSWGSSFASASTDPDVVDHRTLYSFSKADWDAFAQNCDESLATALQLRLGLRPHA